MRDDDNSLTMNEDFNRHPKSSDFLTEDDESSCKDYGFNVLLRAAIGMNGIPDTCEFYTQFYEQGYLFSTEERAQCLEVLGSTHILRGDFEQGFNCWKMSALLRSKPKIPLLVADLPPITSKLCQPEWTTLDDLTRLMALPQPALSVIEETTRDTYKRQSAELIYQAILVRLRYCRNSILSDNVLELCMSTLCSHQLITSDDTRNKFTVLIFECDEIYASHSLTLRDYSNVSSMFDYFTSDFLTSTKACDSNNMMCFDSLMVLLKWLVTECRLPDCFYAATYKARIIILVMLTRLLLTTDQELELQTCLKRILAANGAEGQSFLLCFCVSRFSFEFTNLRVEESFPMRKKFIRKLIEAGADINSTNEYGLNCMQFLVDQEFGEEIVNMPMFKYLLNCGARWDIDEDNRIRQQRSQQRENDKILKAFQTIWNSDGFFSLQWFCARIIRREQIHLKADLIARDLIEIVNDY